jgi:hypothetical protein
MAQIYCRITSAGSAVPGRRLARLRGRLSVAAAAPWSPALPLADCRGPPDRFAAYPAVGGDLDPDILCADAARYYSIYSVYGKVPPVRFDRLSLLKFRDVLAGMRLEPTGRTASLHRELR